ncbi:MAG: ABC transporter permease [Arenicellales bacterium]|nr:ABC transporter permease [Arenicellales bacterium]MDP7120584.1 ABC transporter permease [Arenicellales bacterium]MDP7490338.1 ABC transporter permease [Arenicellales bacterium]
MSSPVETIPLARLALVFIPVLVVVLIQWRWVMPVLPAVHGLARMLAQLLLVGYVLVFLFESNSPLIVSLVLAIMIGVASWIALRPVAKQRRGHYPAALGAIVVGGVPTLMLVTQIVINVDPWYQPSFLIPLAGMIFANAMNSVSIAAERQQAELDNGRNQQVARQRAFQAALIPLVNSLMAVGLVSLPGMMTGQVLAGVSPLIAARYQILVMCMLFGSSGIATACYLYWSRPAKSSG